MSPLERDIREARRNGESPVEAGERLGSVFVEQLRSLEDRVSRQDDAMTHALRAIEGLTVLEARSVLLTLLVLMERADPNIPVRDLHL